MIRKTKLILISTILLFLVVGAVSASDDNTTDIIQKNFDDAPISLQDSMEEKSDDNVLKTAVDEDNSLSSIVNDTSVSVENNDVLNAAKSKTNLKITTNTNLLKTGDTYNLYLTDLKGNGITNKEQTIKYDKKTYKKTTGTSGEFSIPVTSKSYSNSMEISFGGDDKYNKLTQTINFYVSNSFSIDIGNNKLLTKGFLRIYLKGSKDSISEKTIKIKIGNKVYTKKTTTEGFVIIKPLLSKGQYEVEVTYGKYNVSKKINCIAGDVKNPMKNYIPLKNGVPDIDRMPANYVMGDEDAKYTLTKDQYREVMKRDSYCLYLNGKMSKYTFFKTNESSKFHILKREKWNVIERAFYIKVVKKNQYNYWPSKITANLKGKSYTYPEVRDYQNTGYTCGPKSASVCTQVLKNYYSEKYFQVKAHVTNGVNIPVLKAAIDSHNFKSYYYYGSTLNSAIKELRKGAALIAFLPGHYIAIIDISPDGKKILVSNSYGSYDVGSGKVPTNWVSVSYFKTRFADIGLVIKNKYNLKSSVKTQTNNFYKSMGTNWIRQNTNERIPDIGV